MKEKPNLNSESARELDRVEKQFDAFKEDVDKMTLDRMNVAPKRDEEPQTQLSQQEIFKSKDIYLKPIKTVGCQDKFNEKWREDYNFQKQYVQFQAENKEIIGEEIDLWTRPFPGMPAEEWKVPVNKPVWGPRYLAEQIKRCYYHRLIMQPNLGTGSDHAGQYYGSMAVDSTVARLDAIPVSSKRSVFMGATNF
jgi:hypothetical protein